MNSAASKGSAIKVITYPFFTGLYPYFNSPKIRVMRINPERLPCLGNISKPSHKRQCEPPLPTWCNKASHTINYNIPEQLFVLYSSKSPYACVLQRWHFLYSLFRVTVFMTLYHATNRIPSNFNSRLWKAIEMLCPY